MYDDEQSPYSSDRTVEGVFLQAVARIPLLEAHEEIALSQQMEQGGPCGREAREALITANQRLVISIAKRYRWCSLSLADLTHEGILGLIEAVDRYDWRLGYRFATYATLLIQRSIGRAALASRPIRIPEHLETPSLLLRRAQQRARVEIGREASDQELSDATGLTVSQVTRLRTSPRVTHSLNAPMNEDEDELLERLALLGAGDPEEGVLTKVYGQEINRILRETLTPREYRAMQLRYGLGDEVPHTLEETAALMQRSRERVRQLAARSLTKLRHPDVRQRFSTDIPVQEIASGDGQAKRIKDSQTR